MAITKTINRTGGKRNITLSGNPGAKFELYVKQGSNYYSFNTNSFLLCEKVRKQVKKRLIVFSPNPRHFKSTCPQA